MDAEESAILTSAVNISLGLQLLTKNQNIPIFCLGLRTSAAEQNWQLAKCKTFIFCAKHKMFLYILYVITAMQLFCY